jgi:hypothetical protein
LVATPKPCAIAMEDTEAANTKDNELMVFLKVMQNS